MIVATLLGVLLGPMAFLSYRSDGPEGEPLVGSSVIRQLESAAKELARRGRGEATEELLVLLEQLGRPEEDRERLQAICARSLESAKSVGEAAPKALRSLRSALKGMEKAVVGLDPEARVRLSRCQLLIDDRYEAARLRLGHRLVDGIWREAELLPILERRSEIRQAVQEIRRRSFEVEVEPSQNPAVEQILDHPGVRVSYGKILLDTTLAADRAVRILQRALRGQALSHFLRDESLTLPKSVKDWSESFVMLATPSQYDVARKVALERGVISEEQYLESADWAGFYDKEKRYTFFALTELGLTTSLMLDLSRPWAHTTKALQPGLLCGHVNWICMNLFGVPMPDVGYLESESQATKGGRSRTDAASVDSAEARHRRDLLRMAEAGVVGARNWLRYLVLRGEDPQWIASMKGQLGEVTGRNRLKASFVMEYLQECGPLGPLFRAAIVGTDSAQVQIEGHLGAALPEFEEHWRRWFLGSPPGLIQRLSPGAAAKLGSEEEGALSLLEALRDQFHTFGFFGERHPIRWDPLLAEGCAAHARYLKLNPDQMAAWPDAHEEYPDREGFSTQGTWAGMHGVIAPGCKSARDAIDGWMATYFHRLPLLDPGLAMVGFAIEDDCAVLDCASVVVPSRFEVNVCWPVDGARKVPRRFAPELPNPVPGEDQSAWGYPITLQSYAKVSEYQMSLYTGNGVDGRRFDCYFTSPAAPTNPDLVPRNTFCLIPKSPLAANTTYTVLAVDVAVGERVVWSFTTGS